MKNKNSLNAVDLFCGAGAMSYGFKKAGFNILLGIDSDEASIETFQKNHKDSESLCKDIREVSVLEIKRLTYNKKIDVIIGGPPCQGFSMAMAGRRDPKDPRNSLFRDYLRIVKGLRPRMFIMENVRGLLSMRTPKGKKVIDVILNEFKKIGYKNTRYHKVNTADYGIPQKRHRIFIIGTRKGYEFDFPSITHYKKGLSKDGKKLKKWVGVEKLLLNKNEIKSKYFYSEKLIKGFERRERRNEKKGVGFGWQFLSRNKPSYTISARYWKDGAEALVRYNKEIIRMLTPEECARIQSFPKSYKFWGKEREIYTQVGNAVPPLLAKKIAKSVYKTIKY